MSLNFPDEDIRALEVQSREGERARNFLLSEWYAWIDSTILKAMEDRAMLVLRSSKSDEQRIEAKQMSLAADQFRRMIDGLIKQGEGARETLKEISTQKEEGEDGT